MKFNSPSGSPIVATKVMTPGKCPIEGISETGEPEYSGGTEHFYDDQYSVRNPSNGHPIFLDEDGEEWTFDQLVPDTDDDEEDEEEPDAPLGYGAQDLA